MRQECQQLVGWTAEPCGKPAVDYGFKNGKKFWLCAEHYDQQRLKKS